MSGQRSVSCYDDVARSREGAVLDVAAELGVELPYTIAALALPTGHVRMSEYSSGVVVGYLHTRSTGLDQIARSPDGFAVKATAERFAALLNGRTLHLPR